MPEYIYLTVRIPAEVAWKLRLLAAKADMTRHQLISKILREVAATVSEEDINAGRKVSGNRE
jgi:predicted transcriptional regulator